MSASGSSGSTGSQPSITPQQMLQLYTQSLPGVMGVTNSQIAPTSNALAQSATQSNPQYTASDLSQLDNLSGGFQQAGGALSQMQGQSTNQLLSGSGGQAATTATNLNNTLNPVQASSNAGALALGGAVNLDGLSPGEFNATERGLNESNQATGNQGLSNGTNQLASAMNFGGAFNSKIPLAEGVLGSQSGVASAQNAQVNPVNTALGAGSTAGNFGLSTFNPTQANANLTAPLSFSSSLGNQVAGVASSPISKGNNSSGGGGVCCFIFMEAYHPYAIPDYVRKCRDRYYRMFPQIAKGYIRMSKILVPLMKRSEITRKLVWKAMILPLTQHGYSIFNTSPPWRKHRTTRKFWMSVWYFLGK